MKKHPILRLTLAAMATALLVAVAGCTPEETKDDGALGVVTTIPPLADFVRNVGGEMVEVTLMVPAGASPHTYEPTPGQMVDVSNADVYVKVGSGVEFELVWLDKLLEQNPDMELVDCSRGIAVTGSDPHIWNSPALAIQMVENIVDGLSLADPSNAEAYEENGSAYIAQLIDLDEGVERLFEGATTRVFMIYHPSFSYFAAEYGLTQLPIEHEGKPPTPQLLQKAIDEAAAHNLQYVFVAPQFGTDNAASVAEAIEGELVSVNPLAEDYIIEIRDAAGAIALELE